MIANKQITQYIKFSNWFYSFEPVFSNEGNLFLILILVAADFTGKKVRGLLKQNTTSVSTISGSFRIEILQSYCVHFPEL